MLSFNSLHRWSNDWVWSLASDHISDTSDIDFKPGTSLKYAGCHKPTDD